MQSNHPNLDPQVRAQASAWSSSFTLDFIGVFCVFFIYAGCSVPAINEPHYWTKAAHFWNPDFGRGDIFLESGDAHWLFFATFGYLTQLVPLVWAVWIGRMITWVLLALAWTFLGRSLWLGLPSGANSLRTNSSPALSATAFAMVWLAGLHWGHWAGEWVVGGCEAKGIAYASIFAALACVIRSRWTIAWSLLGVASAYHVVTGIWVILCVLFVSFLIDRKGRSLGEWISLHCLGWGACLIGVAIGVIPAISIDWGADPKIATDGAIMQAYRRLGHHLSPLRFSAERWRSYGLFVVIGAGVCWAALRSRWIDGTVHRGMKVVILSSVFAFGVALIGLAIDLALSTYFPAIASKILRFYWFRWNDVALPMGIAAIVVAFAYAQLVYVEKPTWSVYGGWLAILVPGIALLCVRFNENFNEVIPAGDKAHFIAKSDTEQEQQRQYQDWLRVCDWISNNTDPRGLWLTPRRQQSFKWRTGRPELACWKDAPQNAVALVEWGARLANAYKFEGEKKILQPLTDERLWELQNKYGIRYVLLDRRVVDQKPPLLPILYPTHNETNDTFWVFEFPASPPADVSSSK